MPSQLSRIQNWPQLAQQTKWSVKVLAKECGVSVRTLERHFQEQMGKSPMLWMIEQRQHQALKLLRDGSSVKETAVRLGYSYAHHFSRQFKKYWGLCPTAKITLPDVTAEIGRVLAGNAAWLQNSIPTIGNKRGKKAVSQYHTRSS